MNLMKSLCLIIINLFLLTSCSIPTQKNKITKLTGIEIIDVKPADISNHLDSSEYSVGIIKIKPLTEDTGDFLYNRQVILKCLSNENHPYNTNPKDTSLFITGEGNIQNSSVEYLELEASNLTNGIYELELTAYDGDKDDESNNYILTTQFEVTNTCDFKENYFIQNYSNPTTTYYPKSSLAYTFGGKGFTDVSSYSDRIDIFEAAKIEVTKLLNSNSNPTFPYTVLSEDVEIVSKDSLYMVKSYVEYTNKFQSRVNSEFGLILEKSNNKFVLVEIFSNP